MKVEETYNGFEQGPIRPPSEAESLLIRITRNCPWNFCTFCPVYKDQQFSLRPVDHVLKDIDTVHAYVRAITEARESGRKFSRRDIYSLAPSGSNEEDLHALHAAYQFIAGGMKSIFLQDGNSLIIKPENLIRILRHLKHTFPMVERITSYARSHTIAKISDEHLGLMADAGLNRIHIGMESGSDTVLKQVKKGVDKATHIVAGQKVKRAGMELSEYYMPGLGGKALSRENALETADALNQINPDFIRLRTLALPRNTPLTEQFNAGKFDKMGEVATSEELLLFLESLEGITSTVRSDHMLNLFPEVDGTLPDDKEKIIQPVKDFLTLSPEDQMIFCIGRRTHRISRFSDLQNEIQRDYALQMCSELGATVENMDNVIEALMQRFI
ncbi:radical SAM protein [Desulfosediminicola flagellatus]|uniref:radical SAM protein n=1 Tax=Desulfosediminicola flagellatus TaxID=2569541 RepID=UPI0010ACD8D1|nr:radical SAM protein [Desulfosediminicola flagellatus]